MMVATIFSSSHLELNYCIGHFDIYLLRTFSIKVVVV